ncbi:MAG: glycolate oxidase subunit GlcE [Burkholderiales bacterium]|nr:glycolate oxidase subunit GlcE [Burkholderiales bacterium]
MSMQEVLKQFSETIRKAAAERTQLRIRGGGSKDFYGLALIGDVLDTRACAGIVDYEPTELVVTARGGTPLADVEAALARHGQMLAFEPPHFSADATLGGCIASGFSGPRRAAAGAARDFVLGARILNGLGEDLRFGGQVMKNVAGYDLSRFITGSFGTLALITEVSVKVLPLPEAEATIAFELDETSAIDRVNRWAGQPLPITATAHFEGRLHVRLSGARPAVSAALAKLGGDVVDGGLAFWSALRDQQHAFFTSAPVLWRLSIKPTTPPLALGPTLTEWNGGLRWIAADLDPEAAHAAARRAGGHATLYRGGRPAAGIQRLEPGVLALHQRLKSALDPNSLFGPHRIHPDF